MRESPLLLPIHTPCVACHLKMSTLRTNTLRNKRCIWVNERMRPSKTTIVGFCGSMDERWRWLPSFFESAPSSCRKPAEEIHWSGKRRPEKSVCVIFVRNELVLCQPHFPLVVTVSNTIRRVCRENIYQRAGTTWQEFRCQPCCISIFSNDVWSCKGIAQNISSSRKHMSDLFTLTRTMRSLITPYI